jgi:DNA polymerase III sliding clamp (beta) subunit (PCNA family)
MLGKDLFDALEKCKVVSFRKNKNGSLPILRAVRLWSIKERLHIIATDLDFWFSIQIPNSGGKEFDICVEYWALLDFAGAYKNQEIEAEYLDSKLNFTAGKFSLSFYKNLFPAAEFPAWPDTEGKKLTALHFDKTKFLAMAGRVIHCVSTDPTRTTLTQVLLEVCGDVYQNLVATDSYRLASGQALKKAERFGKQKNTRRFNLRKEAVAWLLKYPCLDDILTITACETPTTKDRSIFVEADNWKIFFREELGKYPNYFKVIPESIPARLLIPAKELTEGVQSLLKFTYKDCKKLCFSFGKEGDNSYLLLTAETHEQSASTRITICEQEGEIQPFALDAEFLLQCLNANYITPTAAVDIGITGPLQPILFGFTNKGYTEIIMPMQVL